MDLSGVAGRSGGGAGRGRLSLAVAAAGLMLVALAVAGCSGLGAALRTSAVLQGAGYQNVSVNLATGSGEPAGGLVGVSYSRGPTGNDQRDAQRAEKIVWDNFPGRFGELEIVKDSGGCAGPLCATQSDELASATYAQLAAQFGPRPHGLDTASAASPFTIPGWALPLALGLVVAVIAAGAIVLTLVLRRKGQQPGPSAWPPGSPPWPAGSPPWSPGAPGAAPGWPPGPPPGSPPWSPGPPPGSPPWPPGPPPGAPGSPAR